MGVTLEQIEEYYTHYIHMEPHFKVTTSVISWTSGNMFSNPSCLKKYCADQ